MAKKAKKKEKKPRPPKSGQQIPLSRIRPIKLTGPRYHLQHAREYPIIGCWVTAGWQEGGITPVVIARQQSPDKVLFGSYLVDLYCLGVKDAYTRVDVSQKAFERELPRLCSEEPEECPVELAHEIVYGGIEYAARYGFEPHRDFTAELADQVLDPPGTHPWKHQVEFGKKGKPLYFAGPYDDESKIRSILDTLERTAGKGKYGYIVGIGSPDFLDEDE